MELPQQIRDDLTAAMRRRSSLEVTTLRSLLAAIGNAEAVADNNADNSPAVGARASEQPRRHLSTSDIDDVLRAEISERRQAIEEYRNLGVKDRAEALAEEIAIVKRYVN